MLSLFLDEIGSVLFAGTFPVCAVIVVDVVTGRVVALAVVRVVACRGVAKNR